jgi:aspartate aminotransferase-like enzyme
LFIPGPTHVSNEILDTFSTPQIGHRTPEISELIDYLIKGIQKVLYTKNHIYLVSHAATGLWEMGTRNSVKKGVLHCSNGAFSSKWALSSERNGLNTQIIDYEWGRGVNAEDIDRCLSSGKYDVLAMVHNETSTGVMSDLQEISKLLLEKYPDIIWLVDAVSSMAGIKINVDDLGIDFLLSSTQKAWGLPAGFSICSVSNKLIEKSKILINKGYFLDIEVYEKYYSRLQTPTTPSIPHMFGLKKVLELIDSEGIENRWQRHIEMSRFTTDWALRHGQEIFPEEGCQSYTLTCLKNVQKWDINAMYTKLLDKGFRMDRGYGNLKGKVFRIPHMGNVYMDDLKEYLNKIDSVI